MKKFIKVRLKLYARGGQPVHHGFTIIELMIASTVFSIVLLLCTTAVIQIGRVYHKGIVSTQTQEASRSILEEISRTLQFSGGVITPVITASSSGKSSDYFCIGDKSYSFVLDKQLTAAVPGPDQSKHVLVSDTCANGGQPLGGVLPSGAKEHLDPNMRLAWLYIQDSGNNLYDIGIRVVYGDSDLLSDEIDDLTGNPVPNGTGIKDTCKSQQAGSQFCAVSELSTSVQKRVK